MHALAFQDTCNAEVHSLPLAEGAEQKAWLHQPKKREGGRGVVGPKQSRVPRSRPSTVCPVMNPLLN